MLQGPVISMLSTKNSNKNFFSKTHCSLNRCIYFYQEYIVHMLQGPVIRMLSTGDSNKNFNSKTPCTNVNNSNH